MTSSQAMEAETRTGPLDGLTERLSPHPVVAGLSSGILLWSAFPPVEWSWLAWICLLYTSPSPRDRTRSRMPSSA